jgi:hypothetical protein
MNYLRARRTFIQEAARWFASPEATMGAENEMWWVGEKITEEMRRILDSEADDLPTEAEEVPKPGSLEQPLETPKQADLIAVAGGQVDG